MKDRGRRPSHVTCALARGWYSSWRTYVCQPLRALRNAAIAITVIAGIIYFAAMMPAFNWHYTAAGQRAGFGWTVELPWPSDESAKTVEHLRSSLARPTLVWDGGPAILSASSGRARKDVPVRFMEPADRRALALTYHPGLIVKSVATARGLILDTITADRVGARLGDTVKLTWDGVPADGSTTRAYRVSALVLPTEQTFGALVLSPEVVTRQGVAVFLPKGLSAVQAAALTRQSSAISKSDAERTDLERLNNIIARNTRYVLTWVSLCLYVGFLYRDNADRMRAGRKRYAVMLSLGLAPKALSRITLAEQLVWGLATAGPAVLLGTWALTSSTGMYLPTDTIFAMLGYALVLNAIVGTALAARFRSTIRRLPIARLLAEG
ncbi:MAG: hypothetical protein HY876_06565 [Coriobacteriales bacterium]|nr:hypothetical protein [Coriobacteriales bacterium]